MMKTENIKTYSELSKLKTFNERYNYLKLNGSVGEDTFGFDRYLNQMFYKSDEWKHIRNYVITRDNGCDLGDENHKIVDSVIMIHHMNPITKNNIINKDSILLDPEYLITVTKKTHDAIHYGNDSLLENDYIERTKNDTCPWKH